MTSKSEYELLIKLWESHDHEVQDIAKRLNISVKEMHGQVRRLRNNGIKLRCRRKQNLKHSEIKGLAKFWESVRKT